MRKNAGQDGVYRRQVDHRYVSQVTVGVPRAWAAEGRLLRLPGRAVTPLVYVIAQVYAKETYRSPETMELIVGSFGGGALAGTLLDVLLVKRRPRRVAFLNPEGGAYKRVMTLYARPLREAPG